MKRFLSGFLIIVLIFSLAPFNIMSAFAEPEFISGDSTELLNDNIRYTYGQRMEKSYGDTYKATSKFVKFTRAGSGIEWDIPENKSVKRLDFWVWPKNAIDTYEIEKTTDGATWTSVTTGDWNPDGAALGSTTGEVAAEFDSTYWQSVVLDEAVSDAVKLRFKITGFTDASYGAYIAEASYSVTNEINFLALDTANNDGQTHSIYVEATTMTNNQEKIKKTANTDYYRNLTQYPIWKPAATTSRTSIWQAVKLAGTEHKINRIAIDVNTGTGKEFEIWCSNSASDYADPDLIGKGQSHTWQKVANVKGDVTSGTNVKGELVVDIPNSPKAEYWMVRVTDRDDSKNFGLATANMRFFELAESELNPFASGYNEIFSSATTEEKVTDSFTLNSSVTTTSNGEMTVTWGCDSDLVDVSTGIVTRPDYDAQVTLSATVTNTDSREYTFYKTYTLAGTIGVAPEPDDNLPVVPDNPPAQEPEDNEDVVFSGKATAFGSGITGNSNLLTDNFRHTYKEWRLLVANEGLTYNNARPDKQTKRYVHFANTDTGIEWLSEFEKTVKRIDLWVWPVYGIDEYEIKSLNSDSGVWETVYSGRFNPNGAPCVVESSTNTSSYFYSAVLDEPVVTKGLRFVIKSFTSPEKGAYITEADVRNTNGTNLVAPNALANDGMDFSIFGFAYKVPAVSGSGKLSPAAEDSWRTWPSGNNVVPDSNGKLWYAVRFSDSHHIINNFALNLTGGTAEEIEVYYSNDANAWSAPANDTYWTKLTTVRGSFSDRVFIDATDCIGAEYWKIVVSDYTGDVNITSAEVYEKSYGELSAFAKSMTEIFDDVIEGVVIEDHVNIPSVVNTQNSGNLDVTWGYESENIEIDLSNGNVSGQTAEDSKVTILATVANPEDGTTRTINKEYWVRGIDARERSEIINEEFNLQPTAIFDKTEGSVVTDEGEAVLTGNAKAEFDISLDEAFEYKKDSNIALTLGNNTTGGKISFLDGNKLLAELKIEAGKLLVEHKDGTSEIDYQKKIKVEFSGDTFNVLLDSGDGFKAQAYKVNLIENGTPDKLIFETTGVEKLCVANVLRDVISEDLISEVERQFDFSKISKDTTANINSDLTLIKSLKDINFTYSSTDSAINTDSGAVDTSAFKTATLTVSAENAGGSFTKTYDVLITDAKNVLTDSNVSFAGTLRPGSQTSMLIDGKLETAFVSDSLSEWTVTITMPKATYLNKIALFEADAEGVISDYVISVSNDGTKYTDVYSGNAITDAELIDIGVNYVQYVRVRVKSVSGAGTGFKEICAYLDPTDEERVKYDIAEVTNGITVPEEGTSFARVGQFGSTITITSDDEDLIYAKESGEKWVLAFGKAKKESKVNIAVTASYGDKSETKSYKIVVLADGETIRNNKTSGGGGGSYSGSTSSGGAAVISGLTNNPYESIYDVYKRELKGHWGESEIWGLVEKGIVSGDGKSLNLKNTVKRAEVLKMLIEAFDFETVSFNGGFTDVSSNSWYADYAETAKHYGLMEGDGVNFFGDSPITREEMTVVLINFLRRKNINLETDSKNNFVDLETVSSWATDSVITSSGLGLIKGYETGEFMPKNNITRDEAMVLISRAISFAENNAAEVAE